MVNPILLDLPTEFSTQRLLVRRYRPGDGAVYFPALRANRDHLREFMPPRMAELQVAGDNPASMHVAERCGFRLEGRQRGRHRKKDDTVVDRLWYGLLRSEWQDSLASDPSR